jgi:hypothetical protein
MSGEEPSEYELQRLANITKNRELLRSLQLDTISAELTASSKRKKQLATPKPTPRRKATPRSNVKREIDDSQKFRRTSSRLAGLAPEGGVIDDGTLKRNFMEEIENVERAKRARVAGDLSFEIKGGLLDSTQGANKFDGFFTKEDVENTPMGKQGLREVRERLMNLRLWEEFEPSGETQIPFFFSFT